MIRVTFCGLDLILSDRKPHESSIMIFERCENLFPVLSNYHARFERRVSRNKNGIASRFIIRLQVRIVKSGRVVHRDHRAKLSIPVVGYRQRSIIKDCLIVKHFPDKLVELHRVQGLIEKKLITRRPKSSMQPPSNKQITPILPLRIAAPSTVTLSIKSKTSNRVSLVSMRKR